MYERICESVNLWEAGETENIPSCTRYASSQRLFTHPTLERKGRFFSQNLSESMGKNFPVQGSLLTPPSGDATPDSLDWP